MSILPFVGEEFHTTLCSLVTFPKESILQEDFDPETWYWDGDDLNLDKFSKDIEWGEWTQDGMTMQDKYDLMIVCGFLHFAKKELLLRKMNAIYFFSGEKKRLVLRKIQKQEGGHVARVEVKGMGRILYALATKTDPKKVEYLPTQPGLEKPSQKTDWVSILLPVGVMVIMGFQVLRALTK